jgi:formylmethanofuran dehydrogenase subunit E
LLDGIQVSTTCTVGNQRLSIKNAKSIEATFTKENSSTIIKIKLAKGFSEELEQLHLQNQLDEEHGWEIAGLPENKLFIIKIE